MNMRPIILLALLVAACDTPPVEGPPGPAGPKGDTGAVGPAGPPGGSTVKSGTRLKARVARSEDGASQFLGWWDSELGVECTRGVAGKEMTPRCLPKAVNAETTLFVDSGCAVRATKPDSSLCVFIDAADDSPSGFRSKFYPVGAPAAVAYVAIGDGCTEAAWPDTADWRACGDLPEISLESFSAMPESLDD